MAEAAANREDLVERLFGMLAVQVGQIEALVAVHGADQILEDQKILAGLAKTMEVLVSLERKVSPEESAATDLEGIRAELAERLAKLRGGARRKDEGELAERS